MSKPRSGRRWFMGFSGVRRAASACVLALGLCAALTTSSASASASAIQSHIQPYAVADGDTAVICWYNNARYSEGAVVTMGGVDKTCTPPGIWV